MAAARHKRCPSSTDCCSNSRDIRPPWHSKRRHCACRGSARSRRGVPSSRAGGAGARNWLVAGVLLAGERKTDEACGACETLSRSPRRRAHAGYADHDSVQLQPPRARPLRVRAASAGAPVPIPRFLANAALLLQSCDCYEEASDAFKKILQLAPGDPALIGSALAVARFTCEWQWIESLQQQISAWYDQGNFIAPREYPLTHLTWCMDEARNLAVTRAYAERTVPKAAPCAPQCLTRCGAAHSRGLSVVRFSQSRDHALDGRAVRIARP